MKNFTKTTFILAIFALFAFAPNKSEAAVLGLGTNFCDRLPGIEQKILVQVEDFQTKREENKPALSIKLEEAWTADKEELAVERLAADERREAQMEALLAKATTDAEKKAVTTFKTKVDKAVKDLRTAIDKATLSYQTAVKALRDERLAGLDESIATYKVHIQTSFAVMKESCVNTKPTEKTIRAEIEMIREGLRKNQELFDSKIDGIDAIAEVRADSNAKAEATYTKEMKSAETALRKVLKQ